MSNEKDMGQEDTVLGSALRRAIETQPVRATPFTESRLAMRLAGRERRSPLLPMLAAAAAVVLGLTLGAALLGQRGQEPGGVASSPTPSPGATGSPSASPTPSKGGPREKLVVFVALDQLPPVAVVWDVPIESDTSREGRIRRRIVALASAEIDGGPINALSGIRGSAATEESREIVSAVRIDGDLATVEFDIADWGVRGAAITQALLQQLVYTITEEPGIRRAFIKEQGKPEAQIDQLVIDKPLTREDVLPYEGLKTEERVELQDDPRASETMIRLDTSTAGVIRFMVDIRAHETPEGGFWTPRMVATLVPNGSDQPGKWVLVVELEAATHRATAGDTAVASPVRSISITDFPPVGPRGTVYNLFLDDARPWRVSLEPGQPGTMRLIVDIGGHPQAVSESVAVYDPSPGSEIPAAPTRIFRLMGTARAFEAHVAWRLKDASQREVASGFVTASIGTSPVWGTFTTDVKIPEGLSGNITLEVFWPSPRDGADVDTVAIPLRLR